MVASFPPSCRVKSTEEKVRESLIESGADKFYQDTYGKIIEVFNRHINDMFPGDDIYYNNQWDGKMAELLLEVRKENYPKQIKASLAVFDPVYVKNAARWYDTYLWPVPLVQPPDGAMY
jgi:hypothetical protein